MNYFDPYPLCVDESVTTAWKSQLAEAESTPWLAQTLVGRASEIFPRFVTAYMNLRSLPRGVRRSIQRRLARSRYVIERAPEWLKRREGRRLRYKLASSLAGAALLLALGQNVQAATITVTTNKPGIKDGDNKCSLIEAIINANNDAATHSDCAAGSGTDMIVLPPGSTHMLTGSFTNYHGYTGLPVISSSITITGNGSKITRKKSKLLNRLVAVASTGDLSLDNVTLSNGVESYGGAVYNRGTITITNSTISGNRSNYGGGVFTFGGTITVTNSTISGNTAARYGGGVVSHGTLTLNQSLISGNKARTGPEIDSSGGVTADDFNLFGSNGDGGITGFTPGASDIVPVPGVRITNIVAKLANNGGPTVTHALVPGSPALDAIPGADPGCTGNDQRGMPRPQGTGCDIGAFEK